MAHTHALPYAYINPKLTAVGFEPTPFRNGALSHRLRPLGQTVMTAGAFCFDYASTLPSLRNMPPRAKSVSCGARTHAELPPVDLKSTPLNHSGKFTTGRLSAQHD